jgi:hypothetical protein
MAMNSAASGGLRAAALESGADPLGEFGSESPDGALAAGASTASPPGRATWAHRRNWILWAVSLVALAQMPMVTLWLMGRPLPFGQSTTGTVHVESTPSGAEVRMDGRAVGVTPLALSLDAGDRLLEVQYGGVVRQLPVTVHSGEVMRQRIEFVGPAPAAPAVVGALSVATEPPRAAAVSVDGTPRGNSPVVISDLAPGEHTVSVRFPTGTVERTIQIAAGTTASFLATMPPAAGAVSGYISVDVRQPMQILEGGRLVGTTDIARLMLPTGEHTLDFVNDELGFRARRTVRVSPGATTAIPLDLPRAPLAINAQPWASVWLDGQPVGDTPIGDLSATIGHHDIVFRHPELGEHRASVTVTLQAPARVAVDLRRSN